MTETSGAEVQGSSSVPDLGLRQTDDEPAEVFVIVAHDTDEGRFMPRPVGRWVPRENAPDWDERYWEPRGRLDVGSS